MTEYTKIETAMAIICDRCEDLYLDDFCPEKRNLGKCGWRRYLEKDATYVAPVVRCKDCKYWQDNNGGYPHEECQWGHEETPDANDFCSYGERKDAADVAPVVRCMDCKHWHNNEECRWKHGETPAANDFCSYGEQKNSEAAIDADAAPVAHGHFIHAGPRFSDGVDCYRCSICGGLASVAETRFGFCPFCGAEMDGGSNG